MREERTRGDRPRGDTGRKWSAAVRARRLSWLALAFDTVWASEEKIIFRRKKSVVLSDFSVRLAIDGQDAGKVGRSCLVGLSWVPRGRLRPNTADDRVR